MLLVENYCKDIVFVCSCFFYTDFFNPFLKVTAATTIEDHNGNISYVLGTVHGIFLWDFNRNIIITGAPLNCTLKQIQATGCNKYNTNSFYNIHLYLFCVNCQVYFNTG